MTELSRSRVGAGWSGSSLLCCRRGGGSSLVKVCAFVLLGVVAAHCRRGGGSESSLGRRGPQRRTVDWSGEMAIGGGRDGTELGAEASCSWVTTGRRLAGCSWVASRDVTSQRMSRDQQREKRRSPLPS
ncbi:unnamed protein product [Linum trigynum]|uniref:Uncharacterized protein n=1 Tax=Linum trigynum TaxID=586398 RepID=A0AAV2CST5_9ROSI